MAKVSERERKQWQKHCELMHKVWEERAEGFGEMLRVGVAGDEYHWDTAIVGIGCQHGSQHVYVYSEEKLIEAYVNEAKIMHGRADDEALHEEAAEYVNLNITCAYHGPATPIIVNTYGEAT